MYTNTLQSDTEVVFEYRSDNRPHRVTIFYLPEQTPVQFGNYLYQDPETVIYQSSSEEDGVAEFSEKWVYEKSRLVEYSEDADVDGNPDYRIVSRWDGSLLNGEWYYSWDPSASREVLKYYRTLEHDRARRVIRSSSYSAESELGGYSVHSYNDRGLLESSQQYVAGHFEMRTDYLYDDYGRILRRSESDRFGLPIGERTTEYQCSW